MFDRFTDRARKVMGLARIATQKEGAQRIGTEHVLLGLLEEGTGVAAQVLLNLDIDAAQIQEELAKLTGHQETQVHLGALPFTPRAKSLVEQASAEATCLRHNYIGTEHLLLGMLKVEEGVASRVLVNLGLRLEDARDEVLELLGADMSSSSPQPSKRSKTPALDAFCTELVELARGHHFEPTEGRRAEIGELVATLARPGGCAVLVGREGVGRRAVVRGLARAVVHDAVPPFLKGARLFQVDLLALTAGTRYRGTLEERVKAMCVEARRAQDAVLVFDDLHTVLAGQDEDLHVFGLFEPALTRGELHCVARMGIEPYREYMESEPALSRLFDLVHVRPLDADHLNRILRTACWRLEEELEVDILDEALEAALEARGPRPGLAQPAAALALLESAATRAARDLQTPPELEALEQDIRRFEREKEEAVAETEFELAANLRDHTDALKRVRDATLQAWRSATRSRTVVGAEQVEQVVAQQTLPPVPQERSGFEALQVQSLLGVEQTTPRAGYAAVLLPRRPRALALYAQAIRPALEACGLKSLVSQDVYSQDRAVGSAWEDVRGAEIVIADTSGRDPGVACALGICLALGRSPILLTHDAGDLPAGMRNLRSIAYDPLDLVKLRGELETAVRGLLAVTRPA